MPGATQGFQLSSMAVQVLASRAGRTPSYVSPRSYPDSQGLEHLFHGDRMAGTWRSTDPDKLHMSLNCFQNPCNALQGFELVIYGDSIAETWRGTDHGLPCGREGCPEGPTILRIHFSDRWRTAVIATGGVHDNP